MNRSVLSSLAVAALLGAAGVAQADIYTGGSVGAIPDSAGFNVAGPTATFTLNANNGVNPTIVSFNSISINIAHSFIGDLVIVLTGPGGQSADVLVRAGDSTAGGFGFAMNLGANNSDTNQIPAVYTFVNSGGALIDTDLGTGFLPAGTYNRNSAAGAAVATGASGNDFSVFAGTNVNGVWTLTIRDFANGDVGGIFALPPSTFEGWSLDITTVPTPGAAALLGMGGLLVGRRRR